MARYLALLVLVSCAAITAHGADATANENLHKAVLNGDVEQTKAILAANAGLNLEVIDPASRQTPLLAAVLNGHVPIFEVLVAHGANESATIDGYNAVHAAAFQGRHKMMELLLKRGHAHSTFHSDGFAPVHRAAWGATDDHTTTLDMLAVAGADMDLPEQTHGNTPLMLAIDQKVVNLRMMGFLVGFGVNINAKNKHGYTAVMMACMTSQSRQQPSADGKQQPHLVYALVQAGADLDVTDPSGRSARDYVLKEGGLKEEHIAQHSLSEDPRLNEQNSSSTATPSERSNRTSDVPDREL